MSVDAMQSSGHRHLVGGVVVAAQETTEVCVGLFEQSLVQPLVHIYYDNPASQQLISTLSRLDGPGDYTLLYKLRNPSPQDCSITIYLVWQEMEQLIF